MRWLQLSHFGSSLRLFLGVPIANDVIYDFAMTSLQSTLSKNNERTNSKLLSDAAVKALIVGR